MPIKVQSKQQKNKKSFYKLIVCFICMIIIIFILDKAPNYVKNKFDNQVKLVVNNSQVTGNLKDEIIIKDGKVYISENDIRNFFDNDIYYDDNYNQIVTTSDTKVAVLPIDSKTILVNGASVNIYDYAIKENEKYYIPFSSISKVVYNIETTYIESTNTVIAVSLDRELQCANTLKNVNVRYKPTFFSKNVDTIKSGALVTVVDSSKEKLDDSWTKVLTENGKIGYVKTNNLSEKMKSRENLEFDKQIQGKVSMVWDYFSEYGKAPKRNEAIEGINVVSPSFITLKEQGSGDININIGAAGEDYIKWAHQNGYKVWTMVSNNSYKDTTSEIINDYKLRKKLIDNLLSVVEKYDIDGINLDFENIYEKDKDCYTKLIIELAPRLRENDKVLSVDVTAPDGSADWSLCFDRNKIAKAADYIVYMAYDEYGASSTKPGTTAGYDWVLNGLKKFVDSNREGVDNNKLILAMPFYTRVWKESKNNLESSTISMKNIYQYIPSGIEPVWNQDLHQYYAEYVKNGVTYKIWVEDVKSLTDKIELINEYKLAGSAFWVKGMEDEEIWSIVDNKVLSNK